MKSHGGFDSSRWSPVQTLLSRLPPKGNLSWSQGSIKIKNYKHKNRDGEAFTAARREEIGPTSYSEAENVFVHGNVVTHYCDPSTFVTPTVVATVVVIIHCLFWLVAAQLWREGLNTSEPLVQQKSTAVCLCARHLASTIMYLIVSLLL